MQGDAIRVTLLVTDLLEKALTDLGYHQIFILATISPTSNSLLVH